MFEDPFKWLLWMAVMEQPRIEMERRRAEEEERERRQREEEERDRKQREEEEERTKKKEEEEKEKQRLNSPSADDLLNIPSLKFMSPSPTDDDEWEEDDEDEDEEEDDEDDEDNEDDENEEGDVNRDEVEQVADSIEPISEPTDGLTWLERHKRARKRNDYYYRFYVDFPEYHLHFPKPYSASEVASGSDRNMSDREYAEMEARELAILFANAKHVFHAALEVIYANFALASGVEWEYLEEGFNYMSDAKFLAKLDESWSKTDPRVLTAIGTFGGASILEHRLKSAKGGPVFSNTPVPLEVAVLIHSVLGVSQVRCRQARLKGMVPEFVGLDFEPVLYPAQDFLEKVHAEAERERSRWKR